MICVRAVKGSAQHHDCQDSSLGRLGSREFQPELFEGNGTYSTHTHTLTHSGACTHTVHTFTNSGATWKSLSGLKEGLSTISNILQYNKVCLFVRE